jgi:hypothetical protein
VENVNGVRGSDSREELSSSLTRYVEKITREADAWAEQAKKEAREKAECEAAAILTRAEEDAVLFVEKAKTEAVAAARKEADAIKQEAQKQIEVWLKEMRDALALQLRGISGILLKELLTQSEALKRRASFFEVDFEQQISEMLKKEIVIEGVTETKTAKEVQPAAPPQTVSAASIPPSATVDKWVELKINPPIIVGVLQALKARLDQLPDISTSQVTTLGGNTSVHVYLKKPANLFQTLSSVPEVRKVEEIMEKGERKLKVTLVDKLVAEALKDTVNKESRDKGARTASSEIILNWQ